MDRSEVLVVIEKARQSGQTRLDFSDRWIEELPESIGQLTKLTSLNLNNNRMTALPDSIGQLTCLTSLDLSNNKLKALPESIGKLTNLTSLNLSKNKLKALPESIGKLTNLTDLYLSKNKLKALPESIGQLTNLTDLYLWNNQLMALPESVGQLTNLTSLVLGDNQLTALPESIGQLTNLTSLDSSYNQLTVLPDSIGQLNQLTHLILWNNKLKQLPDSLGQIINLEVIQLNINELDSLPEWIGNFKNLRELTITKNKLKTLPTSLSKLNKLEVMTVSSNNLNLPPEIEWKRKPEKILEFLRQRQEEGDDYIYEAKLLIIGEGGAGKTSLANKLIDPNYALKIEGSKNPEKTTEGIDILRLNFDLSIGTPFRMNIWDFGGQEIYHATHQFFLTKRSLYLLLADTRQDNTDFNYWLEIVELLTEASPTLIIKNEKQDRPCEVNENQLRGRFPNLEKILATNLATNRGLPEILTAVQHHISQLPHIGQALPKTWVNVRKALETDPRNHIPQAEFLTLCDTHGFKRHDDKLQLSGYLHDLGVCLHFQDDDLLQRTIILKPEWGTTAVYKVLDTPKVRNAFGHFTSEDLKTIWADEQYAEMRPELLQLMKNFKLCYEIPHRPKTYIAPQLLSANQPDYPWDDTDNLILRYEYDFMPKGMLTRFIVEMHQRIDNDLVWKEGVILTQGDARAEVIETYYKKAIRIRISGKLKKPLLEAIRHEFNKIHESYEKLRYQEFIPCNCSTCKGSQTPHSYALKRLEERLRNDRHQIECDISYQMVNVRELIDDTIGKNSLVQERNNDRYTEGDEGMAEPAQALLNLTIINKPEANAMIDQSQKQQTFSGSMTGVIASDHAQVSNNQFTQNNNANTTELLQLITSLRQTAATFPQEIQEELTIDLDDVETEIQKPEADRNPTKLKKRLIALATAGSLIATPIAGMTDFANNAIDLATKIGIELPIK
jgi:internalin A